MILLTSAGKRKKREAKGTPTSLSPPQSLKINGSSSVQKGRGNEQSARKQAQRQSQTAGNLTDQSEEEESDAEEEADAPSPKR